MEAVVFHIIESRHWDEARERGRYAPNAFVIEGFIHLSDRDQILRPANLLYHGRTDLKIIVIEVSRLTAQVVYEPGSHGEDEMFPHLYGELNLDAVTAVVDFPCSPDGKFALPTNL